MSDILFYT